MGLFNKAESIPPETITPATFHQWARLMGFAHCGIFCPEQSKMLMKFAYGVDAQTVFNSISTIDFWQGSVNSDKWILLERSDYQASGFSQFFGEGIKDDVESIAILKIECDDDVPLVLFAYDFKAMDYDCYKSLDTKALPARLESHKNNFNKIPTAEQISGLVGSKRAALFDIKINFGNDGEGLESVAKKILSNTVFEEIFFAVKQIFSWPDFVYSADNETIKIAAIISNNENCEHIKERIFFACKNIIGYNAARQISIGKIASSANATEILEYLLRG